MLRVDKITPLVEEAFVRVGQSAFGPLMSREEVIDHIYDAHLHYAAFLGDEIVGFGFAKIIENTLYMSGDAVSPLHQGKRLHTLLSVARILGTSEAGYDEITVRTQNQRVEYSIRRAIEMCNIGIKKVERKLLEGLYGRRLSTQYYVCPDRELNQEYAKLFVERGDAYFVRFIL